ncbi:MAG: hypothetical protein ACI4DS_04640 [Eubacterium sp.]
MADNKKSKKQGVLSDEEIYDRAIKLEQSIKCLCFDKHKAEIYAAAAEKFEKIGNYEDAKQHMEICRKKAAEHQAAAEKEAQKELLKNIEKEAEKTTASTSPKKIGIIVTLCIVIILLATVICFLKFK